MAKPTQEVSVPQQAATGEPAQPVRERPKRIPVAGARDILTVYGKDPNYSYRWIVDAPGRIQRFQEGGWEVVQENLEVGQRTVDRGSKVGSAVTKSSGDGRVLVLMRILKEWYDEDQKAKMERLDALEGSMRQEAKVDRYGILEVQRPGKQ
jgi:hypothetical protein